MQPRRIGEAPPGASSYPEVRRFKRGAQLLGYLEGRPAVDRINEVRPRGKPAPRSALTPEVRRRIRELPIVQEASQRKHKRREIIRQVEEAYLACDGEGGAEVDVEIVYLESA